MWKEDWTKTRQEEGKSRAEVHGVSGFLENCVSPVAISPFTAELDFRLSTSLDVPRNFCTKATNKSLECNWMLSGWKKLESVCNQRKNQLALDYEDLCRIEWRWVHCKTIIFRRSCWPTALRIPNFIEGSPFSRKQSDRQMVKYSTMVLTQ